MIRWDVDKYGCLYHFSLTDNEKLDNIMFPKTVDGITVTEISSSLFKFTAKKQEIETIFIPNTIKYIHPYTFCNCNLQNVIFEKNSSLNIIAQGAFQNTNIKTIKIETDPNKKLKLYITDEAFRNCLYLKEVDLSLSNCNYIGIEAFSGCKSLTSFKSFPNLRGISKKAFYGTNIKEISLDNINIIEAEAFAEMPNLEKININPFCEQIDHSFLLNSPKIYTQTEEILKNLPFATIVK